MIRRLVDIAKISGDFVVVFFKPSPNNPRLVSIDPIGKYRVWNFNRNYMKLF